MKKTLLLPVFALLLLWVAVPGCKKKDEQSTQSVQSVPVMIGSVNAIVNYPVVFGSTAKAGDNVLWEFGDGATSSEVQPQHTYSSVGTFSVRLTVNGSSATATATVYAQPDSSSLSAFAGLRYWHGKRIWNGPPEGYTVDTADSLDLKVIDRATLSINSDTFRLKSIEGWPKYYYYYESYRTLEETKGDNWLPVAWNYVMYYVDGTRITWSNHPFYQHLYGSDQAQGFTTELTTP